MAATAPAPAEDRTAHPKLKRTIGLWMATALVVGIMIGSGIFMLPATLAGAAGPVSIVGWVFTGAGAMLLALVFANLGRALPRTGGPYASARRAFGDFVGFQTAFSVWAIAGAGDDIVTKGFVLMLAGVPVYVGVRWWQKRTALFVPEEEIAR